MRRIRQRRVRRNQVMTAAALTALFASGGCTSDDGASRSGTTSPSTSTSSSSSSTTEPPTSTSVSPVPGQVIPGRPLWGRRRRQLLPNSDSSRDCGQSHDQHEAGAEYASVASFGELALRLLAVGAPPTLVEACHRAALDEIRHAATVELLAGRDADCVTFGAIPALLGRRIGGGGLARVRSRRAELRRIAVESYLDGWLNEGRAAGELRKRAVHAASAVRRDALMTMADDEQRHADLAREIVTWCFEEEPMGVGRALASVAAR